MATSALSVEETNHLRAVYLCYRVAPDAVRVCFDSQHAPKQLVYDLAKEKSNLQKLKGNILQRFQWDQLYPSTGLPSPVSTDFDVTLLICLLRSMNPVILPPPFGFNKLPGRSDTGDGAHIARIKHYRNHLAHSNDGKLSNPEFTGLWNDLELAIIGLGGSTFSKEINNAKTIILDNTIAEILRQLTKYEKQHEELSVNVTSNLKKTNDLSNDVGNLITKQTAIKEDYERRLADVTKKIQVLEGQMSKLSNALLFYGVADPEGEDRTSPPKKKKKTERESASEMETQRDLQEVKTEVAAMKMEIIPETQRDLQEVKTDVAAIKMETKRDIQEVKTNVQDTQRDLQEVKTDVDAIKMDTQRDLQEVKTDVGAIKMETRRDLQAMKMESIPENRRELIKMHLEKWKESNAMFIPTRAADDVYTKIKNNSCLTVTGNSGMGKTIAVRHVALKMLEEGYTIVPISHPEEIVTLFNTQQKTLFVVDDLCGRYTLNQSYLDRLKLIQEDLKLLFDKQYCKIISSCRLQVFKDKKFKSLSIFNICECNFNSDNLNLTSKEKTTFAAKYFGEHANEAVSMLKQYDYFPFLCSLYQNNKNVNLETFCKNPFQFVGKELDNLLLEGEESKYKYCVLVLCVIHNNHLNEDLLTGKTDSSTRKLIEEVLEGCELNRGTPPKCLHRALQTLVGTFLTKEKDSYRMLHDKLFDFVSCYIGQKMINTLIEHADSAFIRERFLLDTSDIKEDKVDFTISIPDDVVDSYIDRMIKDWTNKKVVDFFSNRNLRSLVFTDRVLDQLNKLDKVHQEELVSTVDNGICKDTPLISSCDAGNLKLTQWILQHGADINKYDKDGWSPLHISCCHEHTDVVAELLKNDNVKIDLCENDGDSSLYLACKSGYVQIVRDLLQHGADINKCNKDGWSPLHITCRWGYVQIVRDLLQHGADINKCDDHGNSPLQTACERNYKDIVVELLKHDVMLDLYDKDGDTALYSACDRGQPELVKLLLERGVNVNICSNTGESPLLVSCVLGNIDIVDMLLHRDADVNLCIHSKDVYMEEIKKFQHIHSGRDKTFWTKIQNYGSRKTKEFIDRDDWIIDKTAGASPLHLACFMGHDEIVNLLLGKSLNINMTTDDGTTPLFLAHETGNEYLAILLLTGGADAGIYRQDGKSPYRVALDNGHASLASMLPKRYSIS